MFKNLYRNNPPVMRPDKSDDEWTYFAGEKNPYFVKVKGGSVMRIIPLNDLEVDPAYQPPMNARRVKAIVDNFNYDYVQAITVNIRADGRRFIIDGQHRAAAMRSLELSTINAWVFQGLTVAQEANQFHILATQRRSHLPTLALYQSRLTAGDEEYQAIQMILDRHGVRLGKGGKGSNSIAAVNAVIYIHRAHGGNILDAALEVISQAFPKDPNRWKAPLLECVAMFIVQFPEASLDRLIKKLTDTLAIKVIAEIDQMNVALYGGRRIRDNQRGTRDASGAEILRQHYNSNLRNNRLVKIT